MKFSVTDDLLRDMCALCSFSVPENELVFVALRGCQPVEMGGTDFRASHDLISAQLDYRHMRCTIVQWNTETGKLAAFVGSSVPHISAITKKIANNGDGVNRLCSGFYGAVPGMTDHRYLKGNHGYDRHLAFRNETKLPVLRTGDDTDYEGDDRFEYEVVYDNLHCARQSNETIDDFDSFGCVVVAGKEGTPNATGLTTEAGPWKKFLKNAYALAQRRFTLVVFEENETMRTAELGSERRAPTVRFGSRGALVMDMQAALADKGYAIGSVQADGLFGGYTAKALRQFQFDTFGKRGTDMICGPLTAEFLGVEWPETGAALAAHLEADGAEDDIPKGAEPVSLGHAEEEGNADTDGFVHDPNLKVALDTSHDPLPGWNVRKRPNKDQWDVRYDGADSIYLGYFFEYDGYSTGPTRGLARTSSHKPMLRYDPKDWTEFGYWPELIYPTAWAESNANFAVINAWDRAAMTFGFIQLAAHTGDDFLPFFRRLITELPSEARKWFPELLVIDNKLCFVKGTSYQSLENARPPTDGGYSRSYYHGDLMAFFNPDRFHNTDFKPDSEELHAAARWLVFTMSSEKMRRLQVLGSIENLKSSLSKLHKAILEDRKVKLKYPRGVDGMKCDLLSMAIAAPHLGEGHIPTILTALLENDPIEAIRTSGYGPGGRAQNSFDGMKKRPILKNLVYDLASDQPR